MGALDPDWLNQDMDHAASDFALTWSPETVAHVCKPPLADRDAMLLRAKMAERYREWTGRELLTDLATDPAPLPHRREVGHG